MAESEHGDGTPRAGKRTLTEAEVQEFREIFSLVDKDGGGSISKTELGELLDTLGVKASPEELDAMLREVDTDGSGEIDFEEFVEVMSRRVNVPYSADEVKQSFQVFEGACPRGTVRAEDLVSALVMYAPEGGERISRERAAELVSQLEPDSNGLIDYAMFVDMMMQS